MTRKPPAARKPRRREPDPIEKANAAGVKYAEDQLQGDYFMDWVRDQLSEAAGMDPDQMLPLETKSDAMKIARNMLQQLEWDTKRDLRAGDIERLIGVDRTTPDGIDAFFDGFGATLERSRDWLADELLEIKGETRGASLNEARRKASPRVHSSALAKRYPNGWTLAKHLMDWSYRRNGAVETMSTATIRRQGYDVAQVRAALTGNETFENFDGLIYSGSDGSGGTWRVEITDESQRGGAVRASERRGAQPEPGPTTLIIDGGLEARRLKTGAPSKTLGASTETWVVHKAGNPGDTVLQVDIFKPRGQLWAAWTGNFTRADKRKIAESVAAARNGTGETRRPQGVSERRRNPPIARVVLRKGDPAMQQHLQRQGYSRQQAATNWVAVAYDSDGHIRSNVSSPDLAYVEQKIAEWWPGVPVERATSAARRG